MFLFSDEGLVDVDIFFEVAAEDVFEVFRALDLLWGDQG